MTNNLEHYSSDQLFKYAKQLIPGGVNSPVRSFKGVDRNPIFINKGKGAYIFDVENKKYIDYVGSWGPMILGHANPEVVAAIQHQATLGTTFGTPSHLEIEIVENIQECMPNIEMLRMVNSGTEATLSAIRLARGFTKKNKIIKFIGCYHGHGDYLLAKAGSGVLTHSIPECEGIPKEFTQHTITIPFNDYEATKTVFETWKNDIAAVIVEPIAGNMNMVMPKLNFLAGLRELCDINNSLLIFDEVITGFRVSLGGAQELFSIKPDLTCLGKIIGGGLPVGAFGGRKEIMEHLAPIGPVYQAGTLSGNPLAMAAGIATLKQLKTSPNLYQDLENKSKLLLDGICNAATSAGITIEATAVGGLFGFKFINDMENTLFKKFFNFMLEHGIYFAPSAYESGFMSTCHNIADIEYTIEYAKKFFEC